MGNEFSPHVMTHTHSSTNTMTIKSHQQGTNIDHAIIFHAKCIGKQGILTSDYPLEQDKVPRCIRIALGVSLPAVPYITPLFMGSERHSFGIALECVCVHAATVGLVSTSWLESRYY